MIRVVKFLLFTYCIIGFSTYALAKDVEAEMTFHGTLIEPPVCTINDGNQVDVYFGDQVGVRKVDGVNYRQKLNYQIICDKTTSGSGLLVLSLRGNTAEFDSGALMTDKTGLGIRVYQNNELFVPNSKIKIDLDNPPRLEAVPINQVGVMLTEGSFEAWATLQADYE